MFIKYLFCFLLTNSKKGSSKKGFGAVHHFIWVTKRSWKEKEWIVVRSICTATFIRAWLWREKLKIHLSSFFFVSKKWYTAFDWQKVSQIFDIFACLNKHHQDNRVCISVVLHYKVGIFLSLVRKQPTGSIC